MPIPCTQVKIIQVHLCFQAEVPVNWCPALGTVLANEEVVDGVSERGGHPVIRKVCVAFYEYHSISHQSHGTSIV